MRKLTRTVKIGNIEIGGANPPAIQSMINIPLTQTKEAIEEINMLAEAGCEIIRAAVPDERSAACIREIIRNIRIPFVADIHFDYRLAIRSVEAGVAKLRVNPGNIGGRGKVRAVCDCLRQFGIPVRIGVNGGSLEKDILKKYGSPNAQAVVESAVRSIEAFHEFDYDNIVLSLKCSDVVTTVEANREFASKFDYPLHLGITEAGADLEGLVRSSVGIGALLLEGIGDTLRVSLTGGALQEIEAAKLILSACNIRKEGVRIVSCPTCGRCTTDTLSIVQELKRRTVSIKTPVTAAVMGCAVNGPGEAREADLGIAFGDGKGVLFRGGRILYSVPAAEAVDTLYNMIVDIERQRQNETRR